jgi:hypothetical protein
MKDVLDSIHTVQVLAPVSFSNNTALVGNIVDRAGFDSLVYSIALGANAGVAGSYTVLLEEGNSPTLADASTVASTDMNGSIANASWAYTDVNKTRKLGYTGSKRYTRMTITPASNAAAVLASVTAILGNPVNAPTSNPPQ